MKPINRLSDLSVSNLSYIVFFVDLPGFSIFAERQFIGLHPHMLQSAVTALSSHACYHMEVA